MTSEHSGYLAKYLPKERPECLYRWRLWAGFGKGWDWTRVKDVIRDSLFSTVYRACKAWKGWKGRRYFCDRMDVVRQMVLMTIKGDWIPGHGHGGLAYGVFDESEFWFS